jgi:hypothetical protein
VGFLISKGTFDIFLKKICFYKIFGWFLKPIFWILDFLDFNHFSQKLSNYLDLKQDLVPSPLHTIKPKNYLFSLFN